MNEKALHKLSYGVYVVSTLDGKRATGCIANSIMQITSKPATIAVSINHNNLTNSCIKNCKEFAVSILPEDIDMSLIGTFGFQSGRDINKFDNVKHSYKLDMPVIDDACAYLVCDVINVMETSTHTVFLGEIKDADVLNQSSPMTYAYYHNVKNGKSSVNAPTYIEESKKDNTNEKKEKYVCSVCGYVYDGDIPFEQLPDDYVCPICKQPKSVFEKE